MESRDQSSSSSEEVNTTSNEEAKTNYVNYVVERFWFIILLLKYKMKETLGIKSPVMFDESVTHYEIQTYRPYATSAYQNNDSIRIAIQHQYQCLLPSKSFISIQGKVRQLPDAAPANI